MTKEQFIALGITEEQATKAAAASAEELKTYIPKTRFDEVNEAKKQAEKDIQTRDTQIEELKKVDAAGLKAEIEKLQGENKVNKEKYEADMKDLALTNAIKIALTGKVHDDTLAAGLVDKTKLVIDGDKVVGLDEQLKSLKDTKAFLFKPEGPQTQQPGFKVGVDQQQQQQGQRLSLKDAIAAKIQTQQPQQAQKT
ncbi:minor structural protein GP20 [Ruminiclostridium sufflavum DSM 19573]|uniref:Minor structural protein GP20 n=1 Tax=Ruminiclostridium sufflavum DSM 19573 TaxID=1121337 RepID=A0A318XQ10_9FIRM|nr:phage scaffolding protein [Ruminiclostridium sufflavum]PYG90145.1 minor structural protein GP20 [Ruminiclostridium sufflavum DSM 19573]